jgi:phthiocerol/phenolphthiocerol synthesis type-I polyketide synthase E
MEDQVLPKAIKCRLADSFEILAYNRAEAEHFYNEIFREKSYLQHGITIRAGDTVFDVGANIGVLSLFSLMAAPNVRVFAFEPAPPLFALLRENTKKWNRRAHLFQCGIAETEKTLTLTYYPENSGMSSFYGDRAEDRDVLETVMRNQIASGGAELAPLLDCLEEISDLRSRSKSYSCPVRTLSSVIDEYRIESIDLLKIDVQKSEIDVLLGIRSEHWNLIHQIVMEVHDIGQRRAEVIALLKSKGFLVFQEQGDLYAGTPLYNFFAVRESSDVIK